MTIRPLLQHMRDSQDACVSLSPRFNDNQPRSDPYSGNIGMRVKSTLSSKYRMIRMPARRVLGCIGDLAGLRDNITELHIPHLFLRTRLPLCASFPSLRLLAINVYCRRRWADSWDPELAVFHVQDTVFSGQDHSRAENQRFEDPPVDSVESTPAGWAALELLRIDAQGDGKPEVDSQSLLGFLQTLNFSPRNAARLPTLTLSGPLALNGEDTYAGFTDALRGSFSDVQFTETMSGCPTFQRRPTRAVGFEGLFGYGVGLQVHDGVDLPVYAAPATGKLA